MTKNSNITYDKLGELLQRASEGGLVEKQTFYEFLLEGTVFAPLGKMKNAAIVEFGNLSGEETGLLVVKDEGKNIIPVFSTPDLLFNWGGENFGVREIGFSNLLWQTGKDIWVHLNPGSEYGKDFSPWELDRLRQGKEAIEEIVAEELGGNIEDVIVESGKELFPELKRQVLPILEIFPEIEECFLIRVDGEEGSAPFPLLGIRHRGITDDKLKKFHEEVQILSAQYLKQGEEIVVVDNIDDLNNPYATLFSSARPFYFSRNGERKKKGWFTKLFGRS